MRGFMFKLFCFLLGVGVFASTFWAQERVARIKQELGRVEGRVEENRKRQYPSYGEEMAGLRAIRRDFDSIAHDLNHNWLVRLILMAGGRRTRSQLDPDQFQEISAHVQNAYHFLIREERVINLLAEAENDIVKAVFMLHESIGRPGNRPDLIPWLFGRGDPLKERLKNHITGAIERLKQQREPIAQYQGRAGLIEALVFLGESDRAMSGMKDLARLQGRQSDLAETLAYELALYRSASAVGHAQIAGDAARRLARLTVREYPASPGVCAETLYRLAVCARACGDEKTALALIQKGQELIARTDPAWAGLEKMRLGARPATDFIQAPTELSPVPEPASVMHPDNLQPGVVNAIHYLMKADLVTPRDENAVRQAVFTALQGTENYFRSLDQWNHPRDYNVDKSRLR